jgi:type I restriction enzyme M protein
LDAVEKREFKDKFSYVADINTSELNEKEETVAENDFNLNIPRYVDTFEEEKVIDLTLVSKSLSSLEIELKASDSVLTDFISELGITSPQGDS